MAETIREIVIQAAEEFVYIAAGIILADAIIMIILGNTICKRRQDGKRHTER